MKRSALVAALALSVSLFTPLVSRASIPACGDIVSGHFSYTDAPLGEQIPGAVPRPPDGYPDIPTKPATVFGQENLAGPACTDTYYALFVLDPTDHHLLASQILSGDGEHSTVNFAVQLPVLISGMPDPTAPKSVCINGVTQKGHIVYDTAPDPDPVSHFACLSLNLDGSPGITWH